MPVCFPNPSGAGFVIQLPLISPLPQTTTLVCGACRGAEVQREKPLVCIPSLCAVCWDCEQEGCAALLPAGPQTPEEQWWAVLSHLSAVLPEGAMAAAQCREVRLGGVGSARLLLAGPVCCPCCGTAAQWPLLCDRPRRTCTVSSQALRNSICCCRR